MDTHAAVPDSHGYWKVVRLSDGSAEMTALDRAHAVRWAESRNEKARQQLKSCAV